MKGKNKTPKTVLSPCHGTIHVRVMDGKLHMHMLQRSGDVPIGIPSNMVQYGAVLLMLEQLTNYEASTFYHTISDAHIYVNQTDNINELLAREPRRLPTVHLNEAGKRVTDIHDFRAEHFELSDYDPHPPIRGIAVQV
nr:Thymidylate synthase [uncultured bacterium]